MIKITYGDITNAKADIIVNAANGIGFMGGMIGRFIKLPGVAESIHFVTKGNVEKEAKIAAKKAKWIPRILCGHRAGEVYVTRGDCLSAKWIIHAVTMRYPGMKTCLSIVDSLLNKIIQEAKLLSATSIAIPLLGSGVGGIKEEEVLSLFNKRLSDVDGLHFEIYIYKSKN
ncbi:macro domain-containing protein (plasmid) [Brevibacillus halotolerans]|nr:macro domain-containing protein [Brevibacillus halotolerans]